MVSRTKAGSSRPPRGSKRVKKGTDEPLDVSEINITVMAWYRPRADCLSV